MTSGNFHIGPQNPDSTALSISQEEKEEKDKEEGKEEREEEGVEGQEEVHPFSISPNKYCRNSASVTPDEE